MKTIKNFNEYRKSVNEGIFDRFKKNKSDVPDYIGKDQKPTEEQEEPPFKNGVLLMDAEPYGKSEYGQLKYGVYLTNYAKRDEYYYLGDLREFEKSTDTDKNPYLSYLQLDKIHIEEPHGLLHSVDADAEEIIQKELDKIAFSPNLMDDDMTYREMIEKKFGIKIHNPIFNN